MPYLDNKWIKPEVAFEHEGMTVYHAYKNDHHSNRMTYWFALTPDQNAEFFDVRKLRVPAAEEMGKRRTADETPLILTALKQAIDAGILVSAYPPAP